MKIKNLKNSNQNNEIKISVNNQKAQEQITQLEKEIDSLQRKINARQIKLDIINPQINKIVNDTKNEVIPEGISKNDKSMDTFVDNTLASNKEFTSLSSQAQKLYTEIEIYNRKLSESKSKMSQLKQETIQTSTSQGRLTSFFTIFKVKTEQVKARIETIKNVFSKLPNVTKMITNNIKKMGTGITGGVGQVLKYAGELISLRKVYSVLSNSAQSWLSSQNSGTQQLSANIEYLKISMGSVFSPIIEYVVSLIYQLMKAIQSVVYAFSGINIFAKVTASSMEKTAGSANKASKSLSGVHSEISNVSGQDSGGSGIVSPNMDLSQIDTQMSPFAESLYGFLEPIVGAIKNEEWYQVGGIIGQKLNDTMNNIPWERIQERAKSIANNITQSVNGVVENTDWEQVGNTFAQGLNTIIYLAYEFITTFDWLGFGNALGDNINGLFSNIDWEQLGQILSNGIMGALLSIIAFFAKIDWFKLGNSIAKFIVNIDWVSILGQLTIILCEVLYGVIMAIAGFLLEILKGIGGWLYHNLVEPCIEIFSSLWEGICNIFAGIGQWFSDRFNEAVEGIKEKFSSIKEFFIGVWQGICAVFGNVASWFKEKFAQAWQAVKDVFSAGGKIFDGIKEGILSGLKTVINAIITGINKVVAIPFNGINVALRALRDLDLWGWKPFSWLGTINVPQIPTLAKGGVLTEATMLIAGEYSGAKSNPEIITPQNIMYDTILRALQDTAYTNNSKERPIQLGVYVGNEKLGNILLNELRHMRRQSGNGIEALIGG